MQISKKLPQFNLKTALFIVTSKKEALFFVANQGKLKKIRELQIEKPTYSDKEGYFETSGKGNAPKGQTFKSGATQKDKDRLMKKELIFKILKEMNRIKKNTHFDLVYLFSPDYMLGDLEPKLKKDESIKIHKRFEGNYIKSHPFELLKILNQNIEKKLKSKRGKPVTEEERKILDKSNLDNIYD
ncbi:MAG: hypothetical protein GF347_02150 [Candidatus Moranbacteria bacterium]|nr:hypothetical protein [Candidatus Moranbacteria bacterium]